MKFELKETLTCNDGACNNAQTIEDLQSYIAVLDKRKDKVIEILTEALVEVSNNIYIEYGHGSNMPASELTHQYKLGVTDGHRLAKSWADEAIEKAKEIMEREL